MSYKVRQGDPELDQCWQCPDGLIYTHDYGDGHVHDYCDGCRYRACLPSPGENACW